jgi:hypothetical protein
MFCTVDVEDEKLLAIRGAFAPPNVSGALTGDSDLVDVVIDRRDRLEPPAPALPSTPSVSPFGRKHLPIGLLALGKSQRSSSDFASRGARKTTCPPVMMSGRNRGCSGSVVPGRIALYARSPSTTSCRYRSASVQSATVPICIFWPASLSGRTPSRRREGEHAAGAQVGD